MIETEYRKEVTMGEQTFVLEKDPVYSMWEIKAGNYKYPGQYTTYPKALLGVTKIMSEKQNKKAK